MGLRGGCTKGPMGGGDMAAWGFLGGVSSGEVGGAVG